MASRKKLPLLVLALAFVPVPPDGFDGAVEKKVPSNCHLSLPGSSSCGALFTQNEDS